MVDAGFVKLSAVFSGKKSSPRSPRYSVLHVLPKAAVKDEYESSETEREKKGKRKKKYQSLSFSSSALSSNVVSSNQPSYFSRIKSKSRHVEESPRGLQLSARGREPRSWWLKGFPFCDGTLWRRKSKESMIEIQVADVHSQSKDTFLELQIECDDLRQEKERLTERIRENEFETEVYTTQLTAVLENNNYQLKKASNSLKKMESTIAYLQSLVLAKDLEIQFLKRSADFQSATCSSRASATPTMTHSRNEEDSEFVSSPNGYTKSSSRE